jgi:peptidoglycan L-alanyl-D-glutamate endopeptidase CwlK
MKPMLSPAIDTLQTAIKPVTHVIRKGETLSSIAGKYENITYQEIAQANGISNPNNIYVGQRLKIPNQTSVPQQPSKPKHKSISDDTSTGGGKKDGCEKCGKTWDKYTNMRLKKLHPKIRCKAFDFINDVERVAGIKLRVVQGLRTFAEQNALYAKGRTKSGKIVTKARGGYSYHNYGLAIDVAEIKNGKVIWNTQWNKIVPIAKKYGFEWGGSWKSFKDKPHFQITFGNKIKDLLKKVKQNQVKNGYVEI